MKKKELLFLLTLCFLNISNVSAAELDYTLCGNTAIPSPIVPIVFVIYRIFMIVTPILIIILGSIDYLKAVTGKNEGDIKAHQKKFMRRLITGAIVFFIFLIVSFSVTLVDEENSNSLISCIICLLNDKGCKRTSIPIISLVSASEGSWHIQIGRAHVRTPVTVSNID